MRKLSCFLRGMLGAIVFLAAAGLFLSADQDYAAREALGETFQQLAPYRDTIAENASKEGSVEGSGVEVAIPTEEFPSLNVDYARVFPDGTIMIHHARFHQVVIWEPSMTAGQISWRCVGGPPKDVFAECR